PTQECIPTSRLDGFLHHVLPGRFKNRDHLVMRADGRRYRIVTTYQSASSLLVQMVGRSRRPNLHKFGQYFLNVQCDATTRCFQDKAAEFWIIVVTVRQQAFEWLRHSLRSPRTKNCAAVISLSN